MIECEAVGVRTFRLFVEFGNECWLIKAGSREATASMCISMILQIQNTAESIDKSSATSNAVIAVKCNAQMDRIRARTNKSESQET